MQKRLVGAILGLLVGFIFGTALQNLINGLGITGLAVVLVAILAAVLGANVAGLSGGVVGAVIGALMGGLAVRLVFWTLKLVAMIVGAVMGWRWASGKR